LKDRKKEGLKMKIGDIVNVVYATGDIFEGPVESIRNIPGKGILLLINDSTVGYRSVYANKCGHIVYRSPGAVTPD
jgi:hypothetical protein